MNDSRVSRDTAFHMHGINKVYRMGDVESTHCAV